MARYPYLLNRNGYYYLRLPIPKHLQPRFQSRELIYSLKTKTFTDARVRCSVLSCLYIELFTKVEQGMELTSGQLKAITQRYYKECLTRFEEYKAEYRNNRYALPASKYEPHPNSTHTKEDAVRRIIAPFTQNTTDEHYLFDINNHLISKPEYELQNLSTNDYAYKLLANCMRDLQVEMHHQCQQYYDVVPTPTTQHEWFKGVDEQPMQEVSPLLSTLFREYLEHASVRKKTKQQKQARFTLWLEVVGDITLTELDKAKARAYKEVLTKYPKNAKQCYPNASVQELIALPNNIERIGKKTANYYMKDMRAFCTWLMDNYDELTANPFARMDFSLSRSDSNDRLPFSSEQLKTLFNSPIYKGCLSKGRRFESGELVMRDSLYWIPLLAYATGARMQELCQLYKEDVRQENGIWVLDINDNGPDKEIKTGDSSPRLLPIHSKLIEIGFIDYAHSQRGKRIFPCVNMAATGKYSDIYSKRFRRMLDSLGIYTPQTVFHSFRHGFTDYLRAASVEYYMIQKLDGHKDSATTANYGNSELVKEKQECIEKAIKFDFWEEE